MWSQKSLRQRLTGRRGTHIDFCNDMRDCHSESLHWPGGEKCNTLLNRVRLANEGFFVYDPKCHPRQAWRLYEIEPCKNNPGLQGPRSPARNAR